VTYIESGGGADANVFNAAGVTCVNVCNGMAEIHTASEHIAVADLDGMLGVTLGLIEAARASATRDDGGTA
jgi:tripeptide aminopeptidase